MHDPDFRTLTPAQLLALAAPSEKPVKLRGFRDLLPSGHLAARMPVTVDWARSDLGADDPVALLRAVNAGGNPLDRTVVLNAARVPVNRVAYAEVIMMPLDPTGISQHGQLRFVFEKGHEPTLLTHADPGGSDSAPFEDLVLSWEVWRYRDDRYTMLRALDEANPLTMRAYTGPQRFLEDMLQGHEWRAYRLTLPGGREGVSELLKVALAFGDGIARHAVADMMDAVEAAWEEGGPRGQAPDPSLRAAWTQLRQATLPKGRPAEVTLPQEADQTAYNPLLRSCVAMMRYVLLLTVQRLVARGLSDGVALEHLPLPALGATEPWMHEAARCDLRGLFERAPLALDFLFRNPQALPATIMDELDAAGLLAHRDGQRDMMRYTQDGERPYGADGVKRRTD